MFIAEVGEPPDVAEPHGVAQAGQEEVALVVPVPSLLLLYTRQCLPSQCQKSLVQFHSILNIKNIRKTS